MNNNREERLQMRQRGAATRKIKEVDFGFSFGLAPPEEPASQPELTNGPPAPSAPSAPESSQLSSTSEKRNTPPPPSQNSLQRTPGGARNALPERPSTFDIPADEAPGLGRSSKRRKIESPPTGRRIFPRRSSPRQNGTQSSPAVQPPNEQIEVPTTTDATDHANHSAETAATSTIAISAQTESTQDVPEPAPKSASENAPAPVPEVASEPAPERLPQNVTQKPSEPHPVEAPEPSPEQLLHEAPKPIDLPTTELETQVDGEPVSNQVEPKSPPAQQAESQPNGTSSPADSTRSKRKRGSSADERSPQSASPAVKEDALQAMLPHQSQESGVSPSGKRKTRGTSTGSRPSASPEITDHTPQPLAQSPPPEQSVEASSEQRKTRGASASIRSPKSANPKPVDESLQQPRVPTPDAPQDATTGKRTTRGASAGERHSKSASPRSIEESAQQPPQEPTPDQPLQVYTGKGKTRGASASSRFAQSGSPEIDGEASQQSKQALQTGEPQKATRGKRKRRGSSASRRSPPQSATDLDTADKEAQRPPPEEPQDAPMETEPSEPQPAKRQRGRPQRSAQKSPVPGEDTVEKAAGSTGDKSAKEPSPPRREPRGLRNRNAKKPTPEVAAEEEEPAPEPAQVEGAPETDATSHDEGRQPRQKAKAAGKKPKRTERGEKEAEPTEPTEPTEEMPRPGRKGRKARKAQEQEQTQEREPEPEPELEPERAPERQPEVEPEHEPEAEPESETQPEPSTRKRGRGKPSQSKKDGKAPHPEEHATQDDAEEAAASRPKRKPHQPRGETVPVTVHRLANVASLGGAPTGTSSDEEDDDNENDQESTEELSTRLKAKLPNRGGVNVADVLSQICRETLEKTLTTLNNGITNEGNAARRSEWARKKKAVEAYGTELEGRLFELSEMLDSNFVLGVQMRKAKREMLDQRTRLFQLRKEREAVALRMDAVRKKHSEEENARATRSTINHSLHNVDLALERSKKPQPQSTDSTHPPDSSSSSSPSSPSVGLEFLLRHVAENASSRAPGAQGGLLSQIRAFNAQLESTARRLES